MVTDISKIVLTIKVEEEQNEEAEYFISYE